MASSSSSSSSSSGVFFGLETKKKFKKQQKTANIITMDDDDDDADALRVMLAKAHYEVIAKRHLDEIASALVEEGDKHHTFGDFDDVNDDKTNRLDALWRNARVGFDEATTTTRRARVATLAAKEVLEEKFGVENAEGHRKKRKTRVGFDGENGHQQQQQQQRFFLQQFVLENEENARKLRRDVLNEEMSLLKWREARVKEKKKHAEKRMRIEESSGLPYVPELTKPTHKDVERFVRDVEEGLKKKEYAPTFREVLEQVRKVMEKQNGKLAVEIAAAEYAMLHLGGAKYRAKKFALPRVEEEEEKEKEKNGEKTVKEEEEEEEDEDEQNKKEIENEKRREMQCEREFQIELEKSREANGSNTQMKGANANVITHERWEGRMNSTKIASKLENGSDIQTITYRDVIPNMNKVENVDWQKCGRLGERVVFNVLIQKYRGTNVSVKWVNENEESNAFYDIMLTDADTQSRTFIEVKATRFRDKNAFEMSPWEWDFAVKPSVADAYQIWRVFGIGDGEDVQIVVINNPARLLREKKIGQALII